MRISLIVAVAKNGVIGKDNDLAWRLPDDMKYFMSTTKAHHVIMGRKNWDSIPEKYRPLSDRANLILTRNANFQVNQIDTHVFTDLDSSIEYAKSKGEDELFIIGGSQIYNQALPQVSRMYITEVNASPIGDTYFSGYDPIEWEEVSRTHHPIDENHIYSFDFVVYDKKE